MPLRQPRVFAVVLAAGRASRFGATKQAKELHGVPLVRRAALVANEVCGDRVIAVLGHDRDSVLAALGSQRVFIVINEAYRDGMGTSIAAAARVCSERADAILLLLADQPLVTAEHLQMLVDTWSGAEDEIVASAYEGSQGPPVLLPVATFDELELLDGDTGARALLDDVRFHVVTVPFEAAATDIDTPADLDALT